MPITKHFCYKNALSPQGKQKHNKNGKLKTRYEETQKLVASIEAGNGSVTPIEPTSETEGVMNPPLSDLSRQMFPAGLHHRY